MVWDIGSRNDDSRSRSIRGPCAALGGDRRAMWVGSPHKDGIHPTPRAPVEACNDDEVSPGASPVPP